MWPWGHLAVGYLVYTALSRWRFGRAPSAGAAVAVAVGTQFPDLVDKPLAWTFHVLPSGRSFAHSLLTAAIVCTLVYAYARRHGLARPALAFAVGYITHPFADALSPLLGSEYAYIRYLGWPVLDQPAYDTSMGFAIHLLDFELTPFVAFEFLLVALAVLAWLARRPTGSRRAPRLVSLATKWIGGLRLPPTPDHDRGEYDQQDNHEPGGDDRDETDVERAVGGRLLALDRDDGALGDRPRPRDVRPVDAPVRSDEVEAVVPVRIEVCHRGQRAVRPQARLVELAPVKPVELHADVLMRASTEFLGDADDAADGVVRVREVRVVDRHEPALREVDGVESNGRPVRGLIGEDHRRVRRPHAVALLRLDRLGLGRCRGDGHSRNTEQNETCGSECRSHTSAEVGGR
ncbi:hypothetical protein C451_18773 [Halococcus thailandensis JCM 13552]|uniref:Membrane-bound metal-dependent hydrolase n=1 Tax=Halococcus thailandensis JCM 13552 TaxID=1227457 RepID=M0MXP4_9EURY|nr:hypothetical protein C451_18773 [Halococcus thailandensis JCM 13552]